VLCRDVQRPPSISSHCLRVCTGLQQRSDHLHVPVLCREVQRPRSTCWKRSLHICAGLQQRPCHLHVPIMCRVSNGLHPAAVAASTSAPASMSVRATSACPWCATTCNGLHPWSSRASTSAPSSTNCLTASTSSSSTASCSGGFISTRATRPGSPPEQRPKPQVASNASLWIVGGTCNQGRSHERSYTRTDRSPHPPPLTTPVLSLGFPALFAPHGASTSAPRPPAYTRFFSNLPYTDTAGERTLTRSAETRRSSREMGRCDGATYHACVPLRPCTSTAVCVTAYTSQRLRAVHYHYSE
jgi:hypothetical protein